MAIMAVTLLLCDPVQCPDGIRAETLESTAADIPDIDSYIETKRSVSAAV